MCACLACVAFCVWESTRMRNVSKNKQSLKPCGMNMCAWIPKHFCISYASTCIFLGRFDFCSAHGHVSVKIRNSMPAPMDIQVQHGLQGIADAIISIRTTKSINITRAHKQISVWFLREWDHALSRSNSLQPGSTVKSNSLIYKKLDQVFLVVCFLRLCSWDEGIRSGDYLPPKSACMKIHWLLDSYYL